jgi:hypothetical protein
MAGGEYNGEFFLGCEITGFGEGAAGVGEVAWGRMEDGGLWKMVKTAGVVEVPMGEEDGFDLLGLDVCAGELVVDLLVAGYIEFVGDAMVPGGNVGGDAGVDEEDAFGVVDGEDPDGLPVGGQAAGDPAGGEEVEGYRLAVGGQLNGCGREHKSAIFVVGMKLGNPVDRNYAQ